MAYTTLVAGQTITASWANASVRDQCVSPFADSAARASAISAPVNGMISTLTTTDRVDIYNGSSWSAILAPSNGAWSTYSPTLGGTGWAIGNGTTTGRYIRAGRLVVFSAEITLGSTSTAGAGGATVTIPVTSSNATHRAYGWCRLIDTGTAAYPGFVEISTSATTASLIAQNAAGTYVGESTVTTSVPHTWANTDIIRIGPMAYECDADA